MEKEKSVKKITLGGILSWIFGVLFILGGIGITIASIETKNLQLFISALILFFIAFVLLPPSNKFMINKLKFELSGGIKIAVVIVGLIVFAILQPGILLKKVCTTVKEPYVEKIPYNYTFSYGVVSDSTGNFT